MPDGVGIGRRSDVLLQGLAQRDSKGIESLLQALFTVEPVKKGVPFPSLQFGPTLPGTASVTRPVMPVLVVG